LVPTAAVACGGTTLDVGSTDAGSTDAGSIDAGSITNQYPNDASYADSFTASQVQAAQANCDTAHGPAIHIDTPRDAKELLVGSWFLCASAGSEAAGTMFAPGITLTPDGNWSRLLPDGNGGLVRGAGVQNEGSWTVWCYESGSHSDTAPCGRSGVSIRVVTVGGDETPAGCAGGLVSFEDAPRRMYIPDELGLSCNAQYGTKTIDIWLVPL
jgi:hypothetical protein